MKLKLVTFALYIGAYMLVISIVKQFNLNEDEMQLCIFLALFWLSWILILPNRKDFKNNEFLGLLLNYVVITVVSVCIFLYQ
ncbi:hypothetical protein C1X05_12125 [Laceyella sacchari]|uniref:Uncharacterized protein n=1 Tax=Laceyella tengchongensis TaxID=574699 RepID=A0AA45WLZ6_9BACL|nr:hypothetical protein C1X05_12125 [Laceyella sacchari]SMP12748.1 hypothetical protein SAMN06265361_102393 [Laceyella tengchongensis]